MAIESLPTFNLQVSEFSSNSLQISGVEKEGHQGCVDMAVFLQGGGLKRQSFARRPGPESGLLVVRQSDS